MTAEHAATMTAEHEGLVAELQLRLTLLAEARRSFVARREAMNAAIPAMDGTPAERALYDERYKADHEAERALFSAALVFAEWNANASPATAIAALSTEVARRDARIEKLEKALAGMLTGLGPDGYAIPCGAGHTAVARAALKEKADV